MVISGSSVGAELGGRLKFSGFGRPFFVSVGCGLVGPEEERGGFSSGVGVFRGLAP